MTPPDDESTLKFLEEHDRTERSLRAKWRTEILGSSINVGKVTTTKAEMQHVVTLEGEMQRCWFETEWAYTNGLFQSAILLPCIIVDLAIERYLRSKGLWEEYADKTPESYRTLGNLIAFCRPTSSRAGYLTPKIIDKCERLNTMRNEASHMNQRRNTILKVPLDLHTINDFDEIENVTQFETDDKGEKRKVAYLSSNEPFVIVERKSGDFYKVLAFKKYARGAIGSASEITKLISQL